MIMESYNIEDDYYEILDCTPDSTFEEIKKSYQNLVLKCHPDKNQNKNSEEFHLIDKAWKVLRDPDIRRMYDAERAQNEFSDRPIVNETLTKSDFDFDPENEYFYRNCRCGGMYAMEDEEFKAISDNVYVNCDECSLVVEINGN